MLDCKTSGERRREHRRGQFENASFRNGVGGAQSDYDENRQHHASSAGTS